MQTLPFDVLDAPDPFPDFINLVDDQEDGDPKGASQVLASATPLAEKECVLSPQHGGYDGQVQTTSSGKSLPPQHGGCAQQPQAPCGKPLPPQHGGCAQPEIPHQHGGCAQPEAAFVGKPLPPQHGGSDGQPGQAPSGKSLPDQPEQQGGCDGHTKPLPPQHGGNDGAPVGKPLPDQLEQHGGCVQQPRAPCGKPLPPQHGGCAQPEIPHQHGGCAQPEAAFVGKPLPPQHGGSDGQPGQAPSGKSLPDQPEQQGGCDGHTKPLPPQHGGPSDGAPVGKPLPQRKQAPSNKPDLQHDGRAQAENPCQHGGCAQQLEQAKPLPPQHGGWDGRPGQAPSGTALPHGVPEQPQVRAAPSGHSCPLQADPPNMGIPSQAQTELSDGKGKVGTYDMEKLEDAQAQGSSNLSSHLFIF